MNCTEGDVIDVALLAASASENTRSKRFPGNARLFVERVEKLDWQDLPIVLMPGVIGLSYIDFSFLVDDGPAFQDAKAQLWAVIAPSVPSDPRIHLADGQPLTDESIQSSQLSKWRNAWCDVISAYSHIWAKRDVFVTNNTRDFQDRREKLARLGMPLIATPAEAAALAERSL